MDKYTEKRSQCDGGRDWSDAVTRETDRGEGDVKTEQREGSCHKPRNADSH